MTRLLARIRVASGFVLAVAVLWLAQPTWPTWAIGAGVAVLGELLRVWAAGHLEKSREVTSSGPYRLVRHPLYLGSALIGTGVAIAATHRWAVLVIAAYLLLTLTAARRSEEAHLREKFGDAYDAYAENRAQPMTRRFSLDRALRNREHHTLAGLAAGFAMLAAKMVL